MAPPRGGHPGWVVSSDCPNLTWDPDSELALMYNDESVLENHHLAVVDRGAWQAAVHGVGRVKYDFRSVVSDSL